MAAHAITVKVIGMAATIKSTIASITENTTIDVAIEMIEVRS